MNRFLSLFRAPKYPDLESSQKAAFLQYTYLVVAPAFLIFGILNLGWEAYQLGYTLIGFGFICLVGMYLNHNTYYYPAAILLSAIIYIGTFYNLVDGAAFHDPGVAALPIFVLFTGIFFRKRHVSIITGLSILSLIAIYFGWQMGYLELSTPPTQGRLIILCILQLISGALTWMIISTYQQTVSTLNISEERYRGLVENLQELVYRFELHPESEYSYVSPAAEKVTGYTPDDFYNDPDLGLKMVHPEDREQFEKLLSDQDYIHDPIVLRWIKKDGSAIWTEQRNNPVYDKNGKMIAIEGIARDITSEKNANDVLRESAERNRAFFEESPLLNWQYTLEPPMPVDLPIEEQIDWILHKSILTDVNVEYAQTLRPSEGEITGLTLYANWGKSDVFGRPIIRDFIARQYSLHMYETPEETIEDPVWSLINAFGVVEDNHLVRLWGTTLDITERKQAEETLKDRSEWNRVFFEESPAQNWQYIVDPPMALDLPIEEQIDHILNHARISAANQTYADTLDVNLDDLYGITLLETYGGSDQYGKIIVRDFIQRGYQLKNYETEETNMHGDIIWGFHNASSLIEDNHLIGIWGTSLDITEQKLAERELIESSIRNRIILESLPMAFYRAQPTGDLSATWVSDQIDSLSGYSPQDMTQPGFWSSRLHPEDCDEAIQKLMNSNGERYIVREYRWQKPDGSYIWVLDNAVIIMNEDGDPEEIIGTWTDITERKLADTTLRNSEERYRTIFTNAAEGISIHDGDIFIDVNHAWENMFGYKREEVMGKTPFDYSPHFQPDGRISSEKGWEFIRAAKGGIPQFFPWRHTRFDGSEFDAEIFMTIIELANEEVMISFVRDLTERKKAESAALEERQRLAHELHDAVSQTLFSASMISQTLERNWKKNPEMVGDHLKELQVLTQGALAEMRNLLVELRPGSLEHTPMPELLQQLVDGFSGRSKTAINLEIQNHNPLPSEVRFVFFRLAQESLNNIIKHARANTVRVRYESQPEQAQLFIEDDGQGFDQNKIAPGHHGLEIMKERADKINADINIESKVGKGTSVSVSWKP